MLRSGPGTRRPYKYIVVAIVSILLINIKDTTPLGDSAVLGSGAGTQSSTQAFMRRWQLQLGEWIVWFGILFVWLEVETVEAEAA